jgi:uridine kinase
MEFKKLAHLHSKVLIESSDHMDGNQFKSVLINIEQLVKSLDTLPQKQSTLLLGIDGCGGSGKSTIANQLKEALPNATVVHMDDFYLPSAQIIQEDARNKPIGADFDWKRVLNQVLEPLSHNETGHYQRYDWETDCLAEWHTIPVGGIVIVEGVYAIREELSMYYDLTIWVDTPREVRLSRGIERDGETARDMWENNWMVAEDVYVEKQKPLARADFVFYGTK